ncbi:MAG: TldD/PmbA family protein [Candidatus Heimdallarchaeota archaeon]|nr:TldD/PmbA family protein [Candidatus Heimdallarchaeota archaeon]MDH5646023.1 TldD/PmbA family protein [Candidatus Heimdallarchaeota archaeon]
MKEDIVKLVRDTAKETSNLLSKYKELDGYQVLAYFRDHSLTRFANNVIHQQVTSDMLRIQIKGFKGKKLNSITSTANDNQITQVVKEFVENIQQSPEIPYLQGFAEKQNYDEIQATGTILDAESRGEIIERAYAQAMNMDKTVKLFGKVEVLDFAYAVINSNGLEGSHRFNYNDFKVMSIKEEGSNRGFGREIQATREGKDLEVEKLTDSAVKISIDTLHAKSVEPGDYTVILRPQAINELIGYSIYGLSADNFHQGNSAYSDRLGEQLLSENFTVSDLPLDNNSIFASPLDGEGVARKNRKIIENGIPKQVLYDTLSASQFLDDKNLTSGHSNIPYSDYAWGTLLNLQLTGGDSSEEEMIQDTQHGLLVQTFWYSNPVNMPKGIITGLTRDGLYLIENGEISHAVKNMRYTDSLLEFFKTIQYIGKKHHSMIDEGSFSRMPVTRLEKLKFTGQSKH